MRQLISTICVTTLLAATAMSTAAADQLEDVKSRGKLIVGIKNDYKPFGFIDQSGELKGFEVDLARSVAKSILGSPDAVEFVPTFAANRIEFLKAGRIDVIFATLGRTDERAKVIDFTNDYYMMAGNVLLTKKDSDITKWEDVKGRKLCGTTANSYNKLLFGQYQAQEVLFAGIADMFKAFETGRCEAIAFDQTVLQQRLNEPDWAAKYKIALETTDYIPLAAGVSKNEQAFLDAINNGIREAEAEGVLVRAEEEYGMGKSDYVAERAAAAAQSN